MSAAVELHELAPGMIVTAGVRIGTGDAVIQRRECLVMRAGVYPPISAGGEPQPWAHGRWRMNSGRWSGTTRVLVKPWEGVP